MENLDLTEKFWIPIGVKEYPFSGAFILNDHTITGVFLHKEYEEEALAWQTKLYGVFGYVTEDAELIFSVSRLPIILIISGSVLFMLILAAILIIVFYKRHKKIQKLSKKISSDTIGDTTVENKANVDDIYIDEDSIKDNRLSDNELKALEKLVSEDTDLTEEQIQNKLNKSAKKKKAKKENKEIQANETKQEKIVPPKKQEVSVNKAELKIEEPKKVPQKPIAKKAEMEKIAELKQEINLKQKPVKPIQQPVNNETVLSSENQVNNLPQKPQTPNTVAEKTPTIKHKPQATLKETAVKPEKTATSKPVAKPMQKPPTPVATSAKQKAPISHPQKPKKD